MKHWCPKKSSSSRNDIQLSWGMKMSVGEGDMNLFPEHAGGVAKLTTHVHLWIIYKSGCKFCIMVNTRSTVYREFLAFLYFGENDGLKVLFLKGYQWRKIVGFIFLCDYFFAILGRSRTQRKIYTREHFSIYDIGIGNTCQYYCMFALNYHLLHADIAYSINCIYVKT